LGRAVGLAARPLKKAWRPRWTAEEGRRRAPLPEYRENLRALSREMRGDGGRVFWLLSGCQGEYADAFQEVAAEDGGPLFDVHGWCEPRRAALLTEEPYKGLADFYRRKYGFDHRRYNGDRICTFDGAHLSALGNYVLAERLEAWLAGEEPPNF
ncbi:MAG: SGNH/GDSL hydrolase family protein, partial [Candidatus Methylomirabilis sp.]|nr:SGNH/GDSL hydrolase family protein [Deltaproteobacteria bacterium]